MIIPEQVVRKASLSIEEKERFNEEYSARYSEEIRIVGEKR